VPLLARCTEEFDVVVGSRYVLGGGMLTSAFRYWASYAFNILIRAVLGLRIHDNLSGYLAFRRGLLARLDPDTIFYGYGDYAVRFLYQVVHRDGRVLEIPTVYRFRKGGESKTRFFAYFWTYLRSVFRPGRPGRHPRRGPPGRQARARAGPRRAADRYETARSPPARRIAPHRQASPEVTATARRASTHVRTGASARSPSQSALRSGAPAAGWK